MNNDLSTPLDDLAENEWAGVESKIRSAGCFVVPSDDLRPQILEASHRIVEGKKSSVIFAKWISVTVLCCCIATAMESRIEAFRNRMSVPSSVELDEHATRIAHEKSTTMQWGMVEAFHELRFAPSAKLSHTKSDANRSR